MNSRPLKIAIVSENRQQLRDCYDFFVACGYTTTATLGTMKRDLVQRLEADVVIFDSTHTTDGLNSSDTYYIAIADSQRRETIENAIRVGADDIVLSPASPAKLLVRVRAAATIHAGRLARDQQFGRSRESRFPGEGAFLGTLQTGSERTSTTHQSACATLFQCHFDDHEYYEAWLDILESAALPDSKIFELSDRRVAVYTPSTLPQQVLDWAQQVIDSCQSSDDGDTNCEIRLAAGFACSRTDSTHGEQLWVTLNDRLNLACSLGKGLVIDDREAARWLSSSPANSIFEGMVASDIMQPISVRIWEDETVGNAIAKMRQWDSDVAIVVDASEEIKGIALLEDLATASSHDLVVGSKFVVPTPQINASTSFDEFVQLFSQHDTSRLLVVEENLTTGIIRCDDLTTMNTPVMVATP